jgi:hypothetical protein
MTTVSATGALSLFRQQVKDARDFLEQTMNDVSQEDAVRIPEGTALSIAANYAHVVTSQDMGLAMLRGTAPLLATAWAGRAGLSEPPPFGPGSSIREWSTRARVDLPALRRYAAAVYEASDDYFGSITDADFTRPVDLSALGLGEQPASFVMLAGWVNNVNLHCGEISCLKGLQGSKGYPM